MDLETLQIFDRISPLKSPSNWPAWRFKFESAFKQVGLWHIINCNPFDDDHLMVINDVGDDDHHNTKPPLNVAYHPGLLALDQKARTLIGLWIDLDSALTIIKHCKTAYEMWRCLVEYFEPNSIQLDANHSQTTIKNKTIVNKQTKAKSPLTANDATTTTAISNTNIKSIKKSSTNDDDAIPIEDPTIPNFYTKDLHLYSYYVRFIPKHLWKNIDRFKFDPFGVLMVFGNDHSTYLATTSIVSDTNIELAEIACLRGKTVKTLLFGGIQHFLVALTNNGQVFLIEDFIKKGKFLVDKLENNAPLLNNGKKICSGCKHFMVLDNDGQVWIKRHFDATNNNKDHKLQKLDQRKFKNGTCKDIACTREGYAFLTEDDKVFVWGEINSIRFNRITDAKFNRPNNETSSIKSLVATENFLVLLSNNSYVYYMHLEILGKQFITHRLESTFEPIQFILECSWFNNNIAMVGYSGQMYIWLQCPFDSLKVSLAPYSIPDTIFLHTMLFSPLRYWIYLHGNLGDELSKLCPIFQNPLNHSKISYVYWWETKPIVSGDRSKTNGNIIIEDLRDYSFRIHYLMKLFQFTNETIINKTMIEQALQACYEYQRANPIRTIIEHEDVDKDMPLNARLQILAIETNPNLRNHL